MERRSLESSQSALSNWTCDADAFLHSGRMNDTYDIHSQYGMTFVPLTADRGAAELMSYLEDSLAKHSAPLPEGEIQPMTFGLKCSESWQLSLPGTSSPRTSASRQLSMQQKTCARWISKPRCLPLLRETWVQTTFGSGIGYLHTPTTKANYAASSMQKWPSSRSFVTVFGRPNPSNQEWMMGWPPGWSDTKPLETDRFQLWRQQLCGHLQMLDAGMSICAPPVTDVSTREMSAMEISFQHDFANSPENCPTTEDETA